MNSLSLEWDTFDFYTIKIQEQESVHESKLSLIKSFLGNVLSLLIHRMPNALT